MKYISLGIELTDELAIKSVTINWNETGLKSDSELIKLVAMALLKGLVINKESIEVQELLDDLGISIEKDKI